MWLLFIAGVLTGFHCLSMCGNLVIGYSLGSSKSLNWKNHLVYNSFRLLSYGFTGFLLGLLGKGLNIAAYGGTASIVAGFFMIFLGIKLLGFFKPAIIPPLPGSEYLKQKLYQLIQSLKKLSRNSQVQYLPEITFGSLSGFMPCAPLQAAQLYAAGTGSPLKGFLAMLVFGLGTLPLLFSYGTLAGKLSFPLKKKLATVSAFLVIALGMVVLNRGLTLSGFPLNAATLRGLVLNSLEQKTNPEGKVIKMLIENTQYQPSVIRIEEERPSKIIILRKENNVCSNEVVFPQIGVRKVLKPFQETVVSLPPLKPGVYHFTCQMGMMNGTLIVGESSKTTSFYLGFFLITIGLIGVWLSLNQKVLKKKTKSKEA